jgi:hypothetical protein
MNSNYVPGTLAPLIPEHIPPQRKANRGLLWGGAAAAVVLLCCLVSAVLVLTSKAQLPALAAIFASATPTITFTPSPTPTLTNTPVPTATHTPVPSPTPLASPTPAAGSLSGSVVWLSSTSPLAGAGIMLCQMAQDDSCTAGADLATTSDAQGKFAFPALAPGKYVILYAQNGIASQAAGLRLDLSEKALKCLGEGFIGGLSPACQGSVPVFGTGVLSLQKDTSLSINADGTILLSEGSLVSDQFGVNLDFTAGAPLAVEILAGQASEIIIKVWDK